MTLRTSSLAASSTASPSLSSTSSTSSSACSPVPASAHDRDAELTLLAGLIAGDSRAWRTFDGRYGRLISATIGRIVRRFNRTSGSDDVREIEASFCLELLANDKAKLRAFQPERGVRLSTWIAMLASHAAYDYLRKRRRDPSGDGEWDADALPTDAPDPHALCELCERARLVQSLIRDFTEKDREFLELYYGEGLDPDQVASRMGISVKTVYSKKHKIQGRLEALLDRRHLAA